MDKGIFAAQLVCLGSVMYTARNNVSGQPAIAVPLGHDARGLPTSVQLVGPRPDDHRGEALLLRLAQQLTPP